MQSVCVTSESSDALDTTRINTPPTYHTNFHEHNSDKRLFRY